LKLLNKFFTTITKPKLVISLIILTLIAAFIGVMIPQLSYKSPSYFEEWKLSSPKTFYLVNLLQLNRVYTSVWFLTLVFIILLSLGYSIYLQVKRNLTFMSFPRKWGSRCCFSENIKQYKKTGFPLKDRGNDNLLEFMKKKGYKLSPINNEQATMNDERILSFSKNSINRWGGVIFHSGIFLIIVAALATFSFQKRGFVQLMEGDIFSGRDSDVLVKNTGLFVRSFDLGFKTHLSRFHHTYWDTGDINSLESKVVLIKDDKATDYSISLSSPLNINGVKVYQSTNYGYVLSFLLKRSTGEESMTHFFLDKPDKIGKEAVGRSDFETTDYLFDMTFYPDITKPSFYPSKPIVYLKVFERGTPVFSGLVIPGQAVKVKNDILRFAGIRSWSGLIFAANTGANVAYAGFALAIAGMIINYLLPYKEVRLRTLGDSVISISGATKRYHALFEEELCNIKAELGAGADG